MSPQTSTADCRATPTSPFPFIRAVFQRGAGPWGHCDVTWTLPNQALVGGGGMPHWSFPEGGGLTIFICTYCSPATRVFSHTVQCSLQHAGPWVASLGVYELCWWDCVPGDRELASLSLKDPFSVHSHLYPACWWGGRQALEWKVTLF